MDIINENLKVSLDGCASDDCVKCKYFLQPLLRCRTDLARDALEQIELLEAIIKDKEKSPWISVEEMLPIIGEKVVVSDGVHTWDYGQYKGFFEDKHTWEWKNMKLRTVHWWMPKKHALPEPPEEEDHDELS